LGFRFFGWRFFPFYNWVPLLAEKSNSYVSGFILSLVPVVVLLLILTFMEKLHLAAGLSLFTDGTAINRRTDGSDRRRVGGVPKRFKPVVWLCSHHREWFLRC
jgi:hypothetical protein